MGKISELWGLIYKEVDSNPTIDSNNSFYELPYFKREEYFASLDNYVDFVKEVEKLVRKSPYYKRYVKYIKFDIGLKRSAIHANIEEEEDGDSKDKLLEMHHGPILTLFDYAAIITDHLLVNNRDIDTFYVANLVMKEHFDNHVQVVILTKTEHQAVHSYNGPFINCKQAFGDLNAFIEKYKDGLQEDQIQKINKYIELCEKYDSFDKGIFDLKENVRKIHDEIKFY